METRGEGTEAAYAALLAEKAAAEEATRKAAEETARKVAEEEASRQAAIFLWLPERRTSGTFSP